MAQKDEFSYLEEVSGLATEPVAEIKVSSGRREVARHQPEPVVAGIKVTFAVQLVLEKLQRPARERQELLGSKFSK